MLTMRSRPYCKLDSSPGRVHDVDYASLYRHILGGHDEVLMVPVFGPEPKEISLPVEPLDCDFLAASDEGRNDGAVWRVFVFFYDQEVSVGYVRPDHGLPHDPQEVAPPARAGPHELRRQRVGLIPHRHGLEPASGGDPTNKGISPAASQPFSVSLMPRARPLSRSIYPASSSFLRCLYAVWELLRPTASPTSRTLSGPSPFTFARARRRSISILIFQFSGTTRASSERLAMTLYTILP